MGDMSGGAPLGSVEVEVKANIDKLVAGFARGKAETQKFQDNMVTVNRHAQQMADGQIKAAAATEAMRVRQLATAKAINDVVRATDPAIASTRLVSAAVRDAEKAYMSGAISARALSRAQAIGLPWLQKTEQASGHMGASFLASARNARFLFAAIGLSLVGGLVHLVKSTLDATAAIGDLSKELGLSSRQLQEYRGIAKEVGLTSDDMDGAFKAFAKTVSEAAAGSERDQKLFKLLGISIKDAAGNVRPTNELFLETIDRLGQVGNKAERAAGQAAAFGEAYGPKMGQLVDQGSEGINHLREAVEATGIVLSDEQIQKADETAKKLDQVKEVLSAKWATAVTDNAEAIGILADAFATVAGAAIKALAEVVKFVQYLASNPSAGLMFGISPVAPVVDYALQGAMAGRQTGSSVTVKLPKAKPATPEQEAAHGGGKPKGPNISLSGLLSPKPPKGRKGRDVENQFDREELRTQEEHLRLLRDRSGNLVEINAIDRQLIDINLKERFEQLDQMVHRKALTAGQAKQLKAEAAANADLEKEAADRKMRMDLIEQSYQGARENLELEQDALDIDLRMARTDQEREKLELAILGSKQQQAVAEIEKQIALAKEARDETRIAELTEERKKLISNQHKEVKAFAVEHLRGIDKFRNDLPQTVQEINEQIDKIRFDLFAERLQRAADLASDIGDAFGNFAGSLARFENPLKALQSLIGDLAETMTKAVIEKPIADWATRKIGMPLAKQAFGKDLTGPDTLTVQQMNIALGIATQDLHMLAVAAQQASIAMGAQGNAGAAGAAEALSQGAGDATQAMSDQVPVLGQFGSGLMQVLSSLASGGGGGGGGFLGSLLKIGMAAAGSMGGAGGAGAASAAYDFGASGGYDAVNANLLGMAEGGSGVFGGRGGRDRNVLSMNGKPFLRVSKGERFNVDSISSSRLGGLGPTGLAQLLDRKRSGDNHFHFGDIVVPGAKDDRSARRSGRQALGQIQRGLGEVVRKGLNR